MTPDFSPPSFTMPPLPNNLLNLVLAILLLLLLLFLINKLLNRQPADSKHQAEESKCESGKLDDKSGEPDDDSLCQGDEEDEQAGLEQRSKDRREREENQKKKKELLRKKKVEAIKAKGGMIKSLLDKIPAISDEKLEAAYLAATQQDIKLDLQTKEETEVVNYPTADMDIVPVDDASQLPMVLPGDLALEDDQFYDKFINGGLMRPEYRETSTESKRLYILWDVSPSMRDLMRMPDGEMGSRDTWARAVIMSQLVDAVEGRAEYLLRPFSQYPHNLRSAFTSAEAGELLLWIINNSEEGNFTHIGTAIEAAVKDIRERKNSGTPMSDILCITDGADNGGLTKEQLEKALGDDIRLHVVLIGTEYGSDHPLSPYVMAKY